ncbi:MAG: cell division FtsA domain-containing protein [Candidatus Paceibacterota bacterium]
MSKIFKIDKGQHQLALDVGTESAKALVFFSDSKDEKVTIRGTGIKKHKAGSMQGGAVFDVDSVIKTCRSAIEDAEAMAKVKPLRTTISIGGEYSKNLTQTYSFQRQDEQVRISLLELDGILRRAQEKVYESSKNILKWQDSKLISADVVDFSIDGYRVINPVNFKGKNIRITVSNSYVAKDQYDVTKNIAAGLGLSISNISYGPYAVLKAIGAQDIMKFNAIFLDVGGGTTDVVVIRDRNIEDDKFFIFGGKAFTKSISNALDVDFDNAEKIKLEYSSGVMSGEFRETVEKIIRTDLRIWSGGVGLCLEELSRNNLLPSKILLYGGGSHLSGIKEEVEKLLRANKYPFSDKPEVSFIGPSDVINAVDATKNANTMQFVTAISLANLSLDLANEEDLPNQILKKMLL